MLNQAPDDVRRVTCIGAGPIGGGWAAHFLAQGYQVTSYLHDAAELKDLRVPPGNRLEALRGNRKGLHSIRINDQWRVVFRWQNGQAMDVEIVDYH